MFAAFTAVLQALAAGQTLGATLAGITLPQWVSVALTASGASNDLLNALGELDPALKQLAADIRANLSAKEAGTRAYRSFRGISAEEVWAEVGANNPDLLPDGSQRPL